MEVLFRVRFKIVVIKVAWDLFFISCIVLATSRIGATELCCRCFPLLLLCGAIASHCCCFVVVLQIRIGAITPCYYFALMLLLFPWLKWYPPLALCKWELGTHSAKLLTKFNMNFFLFFIWGFVHLFVSIYFIVPPSCFFWFFWFFFGWIFLTCIFLLEHSITFFV